MAFRPPKGVRPPQLEGKRTGRPKGTRNYEKAWRNVLWGYRHRHVDETTPPTTEAGLWWRLAHIFPDEVGEFLREYGKLWERE
jgi:hypothetical protein